MAGEPHFGGLALHWKTVQGKPMKVGKLDLGSIGAEVRREMLSTLGSFQLAIPLLLVIAFASIGGTVIPQQEGIPFYMERYPEKGNVVLGFLTWTRIVDWGLNDVYRTWWYLSLLILFGTSLATCSFLRQIPMLKAAQHRRFYKEPRQLSRFALYGEFASGKWEQVQPILKKRGFHLFQDGDAVYAQRGIAGRVGPILVHVAMILVLLGGMWGALAGFKMQRSTVPGDSFNIKAEEGTAQNWARHPDWNVRVDGFRIETRTDGSIKQFYSDLVVVDAKGKEVEKKTISVNQPLVYDGVTLYQASWAVDSLIFRFGPEDKWIRVPLKPLAQKINGMDTWGEFIPLDPARKVGLFLAANNMQGAMAIIYSGDNPLATYRLRPGLPQRVGDTKIRLEIKEIVGSTGIQLKADPGIGLVYVGFGLLMLGVCMSYVSYTQVWALREGDTLYLGGRTNRAQVAFEREFQTILGQVGST